MNPRLRRLEADAHQMGERAETGLFTFEPNGDPPDRYTVSFTAPGIRLENRRVAVADQHRCEIYLHREYPRRPPVITWQTPIFHPNILGPDRNGGVCIGDWSASESLPDLVVRLIDLVSYGSFSIEDALDTDAAAWVSRLGIEPGFDCEEILGVDVAGPAAEPQVLITESGR
ncbi:MAG: hypothetical protein M9938_09215 [Solirubrobacterales bacterium]|nr:hypothetical protein [Solirubrobacterales bacterium]